MWPMGHLAVAYLLYAGFRRLGSARAPAGAAVIAVAVGSQFPDLIDKPLSWYLAMLPTGRSLAHSLLVLVPLVGAVSLGARRYGRPSLAVAFGIGAISHTLVDAMPVIWSDSEVGYLLWPVIPVEPYESGPPSVLAMLLGQLDDPYFHLEFVLLGVAFLVWHRDGHPGIGTIRRIVAHGRDRVVSEPTER